MLRVSASVFREERLRLLSYRSLFSFDIYYLYVNYIEKPTTKSIFIFNKDVPNFL